MKHHRVLATLIGPGLLAVALGAAAQTAPAARDQVARPGGTVPGVPALALVRVAEGFNDPVGVTSARDGTGRIFVVERVVTVWPIGWRGRALALPLVIEIAYDLVLQAVYVKSLFDIATGRAAGWNYVPRAAAPTEAVHQ